MLAFAARHIGDLAAGAAVQPAGQTQRRELAFVDPHRAEFAGLVDADDAFDELARIGIAGVHFFKPCAVPMARTSARAAEMIAFQPAIEMPSIDQAVSSQRTILALNR